MTGNQSSHCRHISSLRSIIESFLILCTCMLHVCYNKHKCVVMVQDINHDSHMQYSLHTVRGEEDLRSLHFRHNSQTRDMVWL